MSAVLSVLMDVMPTMVMLKHDVIRSPTVSMAELETGEPTEMLTPAVEPRMHPTELMVNKLRILTINKKPSNEKRHLIRPVFCRNKSTKSVFYTKKIFSTHFFFLFLHFTL